MVCSLYVSFPMTNDWQENQSLIVACSINHNGWRGDSGMGLGKRNLEFRFPSRLEAERAVKCIKRLEIPGLKVTISIT